MPNTRWWSYVSRISDGASPAEIGRRVGLDKSGPTRWSNGGGVDAPQVVRFARGYGANVLEALVEAGFISDSEAQLTEVTRGVKELDSTTMLRELLKRSETSVGEDRHDAEDTTPTVSDEARQDDYDLVAKNDVVEVDPNDSDV